MHRQRNPKAKVKLLQSPKILHKLKILKTLKVNHLNTRLKTKPNHLLPKNLKKHKRLQKVSKNKLNNQTMNKVPKSKVRLLKKKALLSRLINNKIWMTICPNWKIRPKKTNDSYSALFFCLNFLSHFFFLPLFYHFLDTLIKINYSRPR